MSQLPAMVTCLWTSPISFHSPFPTVEVFGRHCFRDCLFCSVLSDGFAHSTEFIIPYRRGTLRGKSFAQIGHFSSHLRSSETSLQPLLFTYQLIVNFLWFSLIHVRSQTPHISFLPYSNIRGLFKVLISYKNDFFSKRLC